jgi:putative redox protein
MSEAQVTWTGPGMRLVGEANGSPGIVIDSVGGTYGTHTGPTPMELILLGLAGCTGMDVISIMAKMRQPMTNLQVRISAERADSHPKVYTSIHVEYVAYGEGIEESAIERAIELSETRYCSASAMLRESVDITNSFRIVEAPGPYEPGTLPESEEKD